MVIQFKKVKEAASRMSQCSGNDLVAPQNPHFRHSVIEEEFRFMLFPNKLKFSIIFIARATGGLPAAIFSYKFDFI